MYNLNNHLRCRIMVTRWWFFHDKCSAKYYDPRIPQIHNFYLLTWKSSLDLLNRWCDDSLNECICDLTPIKCLYILRYWHYRLGYHGVRHFRMVLVIRKNFTNLITSPIIKNHKFLAICDRAINVRQITTTISVLNM
jgi:hypothetical protein